MNIDLPTEQATESLAKALARVLKPKTSVYLQGEIGAGKTFLVRSLLLALGVKPPIKSPSFSVIETYQLDERSICHVDLYRLNDEEELEYIGFKELMSEAWLFLLEWPENAEHLPSCDLFIHLSVDGTERKAQLHSKTEKGALLLKSIVAGKA